MSATWERDIWAPMQRDMDTILTLESFYGYGGTSVDSNDAFLDGVAKGNPASITVLICRLDQTFHNFKSQKIGVEHFKAIIKNISTWMTVYTRPNETTWISFVQHLSDNVAWFPEEYISTLKTYPNGSNGLPALFAESELPVAAYVAPVPVAAQVLPMDDDATDENNAGLPRFLRRLWDSAGDFATASTTKTAEKTNEPQTLTTYRRKNGDDSVEISAKETTEVERLMTQETEHRKELMKQQSERKIELDNNTHTNTLARLLQERQNEEARLEKIRQTEEARLLQERQNEEARLEKIRQTEEARLEKIRQIEEARLKQERQNVEARLEKERQIEEALLEQERQIKAARLTQEYQHEEGRHKHMMESKRVDHEHQMQAKDKDIKMLELQIELEKVKNTPRKPAFDPSFAYPEPANNMAAVTPVAASATTKKRRLPIAQTTASKKPHVMPATPSAGRNNYQTIAVVEGGPNFPTASDFVGTLQPCPLGKAFLKKSTTCILNAEDGSNRTFSSSIYRCSCYDAAKKNTGKAPTFCPKVRVVQFPVDGDDSRYNYHVQRPENDDKQQFHLNLDGTQSEFRVNGMDGEARALF